MFTKHLVVISGVDQGRSFPLPSEGPIQIGRGKDTHTCLGDRAVSRHHCQLEADGDQFRISDTHSADGTYVNGKRILLSQPLTDGDIIRIGSTELRLEAQELPDLPTLDRVPVVVNASPRPRLAPETPRFISTEPERPAPERGRPDSGTALARRSAEKAPVPPRRSGESETVISMRCPAPECGQLLRARRKCAGTHVGCPNCGRLLVVPGEQAVQAQVIPVAALAPAPRKVAAPAPAPLPAEPVVPFWQKGPFLALVTGVLIVAAALLWYSGLNAL
jgi:pSer/pThr/pTyr-binding forkhead associated (FHA) protein